MKAAREVKQIAMSEAGCSNGYSRHLIALCSDDTIWEFQSTSGEPRWVQLPPVPPRDDVKGDWDFDEGEF
jgi:hypothetical protein